MRNNKTFFILVSFATICLCSDTYFFTFNPPTVKKFLADPINVDFHREMGTGDITGLY